MKASRVMSLPIDCDSAAPRSSIICINSSILALLCMSRAVICSEIADCRTFWGICSATQNGCMRICVQWQQKSTNAWDFRQDWLILDRVQEIPALLNLAYSMVLLAVAKLSYLPAVIRLMVVRLMWRAESAAAQVLSMFAYR